VSDAERVTARIEEATRRVAERDAIAVRLGSARTARDAAAAEAAAAEAAQVAEQEDVTRLETLSPTRIWATLKSTRDGDLARERAERDRASYLTAEAYARLSRLDAEVTQREQSLAAYATADADLEGAWQSKEEYLCETGAPHAEELVAVAGESARLHSRLKELKEAAVAAVDSRRALAEVERLLGSARNWSNWDTFMGGGMISDMVKYDKVDQATSALRYAQTTLDTLSRELADVGQQATARLDASFGLKVFDVVFDNIFSDLAMRSRVINAHDVVRGVLPKVIALLPPLDAEMTQIGERLDELAGRRTVLLRS
jgi:hypothetical protein